MKERIRSFVAVLPLLVCARVDAGLLVTSGTGTSSNDAALTAVVNQFRSDLGTLNPNTAGSFGSGRREINWDGVPLQFDSPNNLPGNFFNSNSPRGIVLSTPGSGLQVSGNDDPTTPGVDESRFGNLNASYPSTFQTFSPTRLFTALGSTTTDVTFFVAGTSTPALVSGFGAIFADVDQANVTSLQFFDANGNSVGTFYVDPLNQGLSFLGVRGSSGETFSRVRITSGNTAPGPNDGGNVDVVAMDDFIYGEPLGNAAAAPEPTTMLLSGAGLILCMIVARKRR